MAYLEHLDEILNHILLEKTDHQMKVEEVKYIKHNVFLLVIINNYVMLY